MKTSTGWEIDAQSKSEDYLICLADAGELFDSGHVEAVRVVKETYDAARRVAHEEVLYRSPRRAGLKRSNSRTARSNKSGARNSSAKARVRTRARRKAGSKAKPKSKFARFATTFFVAGVISLGGAALVAYLVLGGFEQLRGMDIAPDKSVSKFVAEFMFVAAFISLFVPLMCRFGPSVRTAHRKARSDEAKTKRRAKAAAAGVVPDQTAAPVEPANGEPWYRQIFREDSPEQTQTSPGEDDPPEGDAGEEAETEDVTPLPDQPDSGADDPAEDISEIAAETEDETPLREEAAGVSMDLLKFIGESLEPLAAADRQMNAFNRFGLTLYFAGTSEYLASRRQLSDQELQDILRAHVQMLGHTPEMARRFCDNIEEFLVNPKISRCTRRAAPRWCSVKWIRKVNTASSKRWISGTSRLHRP